MNISAAIADPLHDRPSAGGLAPRTLTVLHEYASGPHGSARRSRDAAQRFRDEPSRTMRARLSQFSLSFLGACPTLPFYCGERSAAISGVLGPRKSSPY